MNTCPKCGVDNPPFNDVCRLCESPLAAAVANAPATMAITAERPTPSPRLDDDVLEVKPFRTELSPQPVPAPKWLRIFGVISILMGIGIPLANYFFVKEGIDKFVANGFSESVVLPLWINIWMFVAIGGYLALSGLGLLGPTLWGRRMSMFFVGLAVIGAVVAVVNGNITKVLAEEEFHKMHQHSMFASLRIEYFAAAPLFPPAYGLLLLVFTLLPPVRDWAKGTSAIQRGLPPEQAWAPMAKQPPVHNGAMLSMVLSLVPFLLITQIVSLIMGIVALRAIRRSEGRYGGKGYAWAGIIISTLILTCMGGLISLAIVGAALAPRRAPERDAPKSYYYDDVRESDDHWHEK